MTQPRNYNILNNRYLMHHEEKLQADDEIQRAEVAQKFWKRNNFDPITIQYYDEKKEADYQENLA